MRCFSALCVQIPREIKHLLKYKVEFDNLYDLREEMKTLYIEKKEIKKKKKELQKEENKLCNGEEINMKQLQVKKLNRTKKTSMESRISARMNELKLDLGMDEKEERIKVLKEQQKDLHDQKGKIDTRLRELEKENVYNTEDEILTRMERINENRDSRLEKMCPGKKHQFFAQLGLYNQIMKIYETRRLK